MNSIPSSPISITNNDHTEQEYFGTITPNALSSGGGPFSTSPTNSVSYALSSSQQSTDISYERQERKPRTSFIAQRMDESEKPYVLSPQSTVLQHEFPDGGPIREKLVEMNYTISNGQQFLKFGGMRAIENMKGTLRHYGFPGNMNIIVDDIENNLVYPLNRILDRQVKISSHYEMYYRMLFHSLIFIAICTLGFGIVLFPCLAMVQYLHWKHVRNYDKNVKGRIRKILERENKKFLPHGFEWFVKYSIVDAEKKTTVGLFTGLTCVHEVTLSLIHLRPSSIKLKLPTPTIEIPNNQSTRDQLANPIDSSLTCTSMESISISQV